MTLWQLICCEKKKSYQTVFEKIGILCKISQFQANFGQFHPLQAIQALQRLYSRYMILWKLICSNKKESYQTVFEKICILCKISQFQANFGKFDPLQAIQATRRLHSRFANFRTLWQLIFCENKKSYQTVFEKIGILSKICQFQANFGQFDPL